MTQVVIYRCKACGRVYGPLGMHGFSPERGEGEICVLCRNCMEILVGKLRTKRLESPRCPNCRSILDIFDGRCPSCGSEEIYFRDINIPIEFEYKAVNMKELCMSWGIVMGTSEGDKGDNREG